MNELFQLLDVRQTGQGIATRRAVELNSACKRVSDLTSNHFDDPAMVIVKAVGFRRIKRQHAHELVVRYQGCTYATSQAKCRRFRGISEAQRRVGVRNG